MRDLRVRWDLEEAGLPYRVESTPFRTRGAVHDSDQPFGQAPCLTDGDLSIFESAAILLHPGERSAMVMPLDPRGRNETIQWLFAALNSVEMASLPWSLFKVSDDASEAPGSKHRDASLKLRLEHMKKTLAGREWLAAEAFSVADIVMADALRLVDRFSGLAEFRICRADIARARARPAFARAPADQMAHFAAADEQRRREKLCGLPGDRREPEPQRAEHFQHG